MRIGIQGFKPERLKQLRLSADMTQTELAEKLECAAGNISKWEKGDSCPSAQSFNRLCEIFFTTKKWLLEAPVQGHKTNPSFYRSQVSTHKSSWEIGRVRLNWLEEISYKLQEALEFPPVDIPLFEGDDARLIDDSDIERLATNFREKWGLGNGPIKDVVHTLEKSGVIVARDEIGYVKMDGISKWSLVDNRPYVLLAADKAAPVRNRFDAAHELGHIVLHSKISNEQYLSHYDLIERQAHRFASAFLMPAESFSHEVSYATLDTFHSMKPRWNVSIASMIKRCIDLELVSPEAGIRLWKARSARGWVKSEPLDDSIPFEQPKLLSRSVQMLVENKILSKDQLRNELGLPTARLERLCNLPKDYFSTSSKDRVLDLRLRTSSSKTSNSTIANGHQKVLHFPKKSS